jgi:uncharacterized damage-inducible protein DinB
MEGVAVDSIQLLRLQSDQAFEDLCKALEGVDQNLSWASFPIHPDQYLHTSGSIIGIVHHVAGGKLIYASMAFLNGEVRWRDLAEMIDTIGTDWPATLEFLHSCHQRWMDSWAKLSSQDLNRSVAANRSEEWPAWKLISLVAYHDAHHTGQIEIAKATLSPSDTPPARTEADDIREYCRDSPLW